MKENLAEPCVFFKIFQNLFLKPDKTAVGEGQTEKIFEMRSISDFLWMDFAERLFYIFSKIRFFTF